MILEKIPGTVVSFSQFGTQFSFFVNRETDLIQTHHREGKLYEREELEIIERHRGNSGAFLDIGANVGNHSIFFAKVLRAKVIAFEANPYTARLLDLNVSLNKLTSMVDTSFVGIGLGCRPDTLKVIYPYLDNLGAARLAKEGLSHNQEKYPSYEVPVCTLDGLNLNLLYERRIGFIKLDVEGMELDVLSGAARFIAAHRPTMFVEIDNVNSERFSSWVENNHYKVVDKFKRYSQNENYLIVSIDS